MIKNKINSHVNWRPAIFKNKFFSIKTKKITVGTCKSLFCLCILLGKNNNNVHPQHSVTYTFHYVPEQKEVANKYNHDSRSFCLNINYAAHNDANHCSGGRHTKQLTSAFFCLQDNSTTTWGMEFRWGDESLYLAIHSKSSCITSIIIVVMGGTNKKADCF